MKKVILIFSFLSALNAFAQEAEKSVLASEYLCVLPQAEEFRVFINLTDSTASFFDNDTESVMTYSAERMSTSIPEARVLIFVGKDEGGSGHLQLEFNNISRRIRLSTIETDGTIELLGFAKCKPAVNELSSR